MAYHNAVIRCKDGKLVQSCYQIPARSDIAGDKDTESQDGKRVHQSIPDPTDPAHFLLRLSPVECWRQQQAGRIRKDMIYIDILKYSSSLGSLESSFAQGPSELL